MQNLEPYYSWRDLYIASEDENSPFYGREYSEFEYSNTIYNYFIHPQWDDFGSQTLYIKVLYADYDLGFAIIEMIGEWNDAINNDIMFLKREVAEDMMLKGIRKFILIGENVLNYHCSDDCYYEEWFQEVQEQTTDGWIAFVNFREHVMNEFARNNIDYYVVSGGELDDLNWRTFNPLQLFHKVESIVNRRLR